MFQTPRPVSPLTGTAHSRRNPSLPDSTLVPSSIYSGSQYKADSLRPREASVPHTKAVGGLDEPGLSPAISVNEEDPRQAFPGTFSCLQSFEHTVADRQRKAEQRAQRKREERERTQRANDVYEPLYIRLLRSTNARPESSWGRPLTILRSLGIPPFKSTPIRKERKPLSHDEKLGLAEHFYPQRFSTKALVIDFYEDRAERHEIEVGRIVESWRWKPDDVKVRWIHAPFGRGVTHSSIEDIFLHECPKRRKFTNGGESVWPFIGVESMSFRSWYDFKRLRDVYLLLCKDQELQETLNYSKFEFKGRDKQTFLERDMAWRADHIDTTLDFWDLVQSDLPLKLTEGPGLSEPMMTMYQYCKLGPRNGLQELKRDDDDYQDEQEWSEWISKPVTEDEKHESARSHREAERKKEAEQERRKARDERRLEKEKQGPKARQALTKHPYFKKSQLVRKDFRAFHGDDCLLTMSAAQGVDYLDTEFEHYLRISGYDRLRNSDATCIGRIFERFQRVGCHNWPSKTSEWLLVHVMTEIGTCPNPFNMGMVAPTLEEAYQAVVLDLERRRYDKWQRNETVKLVRDMLVCADELAVLCSVYQRRVKTFRGLLKDLEAFEAEDKAAEKRAALKANSLGKKPSVPSPNPSIDPPGDEAEVEEPDAPVEQDAPETSIQRVRHALRICEDNSYCFDRLQRDLQNSLSALFQLRSIEQDELSKAAQKQNRVIMIFTIVTVIFLPLGFFTSYYGMNLQDITGDEHSQAYFWKICGTIALVMVFGVISFAFWNQLKWYGAKRPQRYEPNVEERRMRQRWGSV